MASKYISRARTVYGLLLLGAVVSFAQSARQGVEPQTVAVREPERSEGNEMRRASLRATLKSQTENAAKGATPVAPERQLSDTERAALRQQLRQQIAGK